LLVKITTESESLLLQSAVRDLGISEKEKGREKMGSL
jgi:hypothetical protein